jgi:hypothetical protein
VVATPYQPAPTHPPERVRERIPEVRELPPYYQGYPEAHAPQAPYVEPLPRPVYQAPEVITEPLAEAPRQILPLPLRPSRNYPPTGTGTTALPEPEPEQKSSAPEEKGSAFGKPEQKSSGGGTSSGTGTGRAGKPTAKLKTYNGLLGRKHTEQQITDILDVYLLSQHRQGRGVLPLYVTDRMQRKYKEHKRLDERRKVLEHEGKLSSTNADIRGGNIVSMGQRKA